MKRIGLCIMGIAALLAILFFIFQSQLTEEQTKRLALIEEESIPGKPSRIFINHLLAYLWERLDSNDGRDKWVERSLKGLTEGIDYPTMYDFIEYENRRIKDKFFVAIVDSEASQVAPFIKRASRETNPNKNLLKNKTLKQPNRSITNGTEV